MGEPRIVGGGVMFVIFKNDSEERLININQINAIWQDKTSKEPCFHIEYFGGRFSFNSLESNRYIRRVKTLEDAWNALKLIKRLNEEVEQCQ